MEQKEKIRRLLQSRWWDPEHRDVFAPDFKADFINAPPGMKQHMDTFEAGCCAEWLARTVKTWEADVRELYAEADGNAFWSIGTWGGDVFWGNRNGHFSALYILRIVLSDDKVSYIRLMTDPLAMLRAAGREIPLFRMKRDGPEIEACIEKMKNDPSALASMPIPQSVDSQDPLSADEVKRRIQGNIDYFMGRGMDFTPAPDAYHAVNFLPAEMKAVFSPEEMPSVFAWNMMTWREDSTFETIPGTVYPTEDPRVFFMEFSSKGKFYWYGNEETGFYHNIYMYLLCMDDMGRVTRYEEFVDPMNKFNSINTSVPSFPYYF